MALAPDHSDATHIVTWGRQRQFMNPTPEFLASSSALAAIVTALVAIWALLHQESLSQKKARPVLIPTVELRFEPKRLNFCLQNYRPSSAFDVELTFDGAQEWLTPEMPESFKVR